MSAFDPVWTLGPAICDMLEFGLMWRDG